MIFVDVKPLIIVRGCDPASGSNVVRNPKFFRKVRRERLRKLPKTAQTLNFDASRCPNPGHDLISQSGELNVPNEVLGDQTLVERKRLELQGVRSRATELLLQQCRNVDGGVVVKVHLAINNRLAL